MSIIRIENLCCNLDNNLVFNNMSFDINSGTWNTVLGNGKSTLIKIISGLINFDGNIFIDDIIVNSKNINKIRKIIGVVFDNPNNYFVTETVYDEIAFKMENMGYGKNRIKKSCNEVIKALDIENLIDKNPNLLSGGEKSLVGLASALADKPNILFLDEALLMIDGYKRNLVLNYLKELNDNGMTIVNFTNDTREILYGDNLIILDDGKVVCEGSNMDVFKNQDLFKKMGLLLPFEVDLSYKLMAYEVVDEVYFDMKDMVDVIWK